MKWRRYQSLINWSYEIFWTQWIRSYILYFRFPHSSQIAFYNSAIVNIHLF